MPDQPDSTAATQPHRKTFGQVHPSRLEALLDVYHGMGYETERLIPYSDGRRTMFAVTFRKGSVESL